jgi:hypothetical protein
MRLASGLVLCINQKKEAAGTMHLARRDPTKCARDCLLDTVELFVLEALKLVEICYDSHRNDWLRCTIATDNA